MGANQLRWTRSWLRSPTQMREESSSYLSSWFSRSASILHETVKIWNIEFLLQKSTHLLFSLISAMFQYFFVVKGIQKAIKRDIAKESWPLWGATWRWLGKPQILEVLNFCYACFLLLTFLWLCISSFPFFLLLFSHPDVPLTGLIGVSKLSGRWRFFLLRIILIPLFCSIIIRWSLNCCNLPFLSAFCSVTWTISPWLLEERRKNKLPVLLGEMSCLVLRELFLLSQVHLGQLPCRKHYPQHPFVMLSMCCIESDDSPRMLKGVPKLLSF